MTLHQVLDRLGAIAELVAEADNEAARAEEYKLHTDALKVIASGCPMCPRELPPHSLARWVLMSREIWEA